MNNGEAGENNPRSTGEHKKDLLETLSLFGGRLKVKIKVKLSLRFT
jgi:hypothetical protein